MDFAPVYEYESEAQAAVGGVRGEELFFYWSGGVFVESKVGK